MGTAPRDPLTDQPLALRAAQDEARANAPWGAVMGTMQGLKALYDQTGRRAEWKRLVDEIAPDFVDRATCIAPSEEAIKLYQRIGDRPAEAAAAFNLGHASKEIEETRGLIARIAGEMR